MLQSQIEKERREIIVKTKPSPETIPAPKTEAIPSPTPTQEVSPATITQEQPGIVLEAIPKTNINPISRAYLGVSAIPFRLAAPHIASESPQGQVTATAQHMLFQKRITSSSFMTARQKALSLGINPKAFDNLLKEIAIQERLFPGLYRRIASGYGIQEIIVKTGVPQAVAGQLFLAPSQQAGSLVMPRRSFLGNILSRAGSQLFGKAFKGFATKKAVAGTAKK